MNAAEFANVMAQAAQTAQQNMQQMQQAMQAQHAAQLAQLALQAATPPAPRGPRFAAPTAFDGRSDTFDRWKADMLRQFEWYNTPGDADRIRVAAAHLQGPAGDWWASLPQPRPATWLLFLAALEARFQPVNSAEIARTKLYALSQGKLTTNEYVDSFRRLLARIPDMGAPDQFHQFRRGLRPAIVAQLDVQYPPITSLDAAINIAVRVGSRFDMAASSSSNSSSSSSSSGSHHAPMELDNIEGLEHDTTNAAADAPITRAEMKLMIAAMQDTRRRGAGAGSSNGRSSSSSSRNGRPGGLPRMPHLTEDQVKEYMAAGKCFGCGAKDHTSRDCPKRKKGADGRVSWSN
jgi:hypothetical protein